MPKKSSVVPNQVRTSATFNQAVGMAMQKFKEEMAKNGWYRHGGYGKGDTVQEGNVKLTNHNVGKSRYTGFSFVWKEYWEPLEGPEGGVL